MLLLCLSLSQRCLQLFLLMSPYKIILQYPLFKKLHDPPIPHALPLTPLSSSVLWDPLQNSILRAIPTPLLPKQPMLAPLPFSDVKELLALALTHPLQASATP